jgi:predicted acyl esterase
MMNRPLHDKKDPKGVDESTDTYDTIDWLTKNVPKNNGRVGILGVSYDGWLSAVATVDAHPALRASSPQAPMTDAWLGDDFFHQRRISAKLWLRIRQVDGDVERRY